MIDWMKWITFSLAVLGSALGVMNTWRAIDRDKVKLRVRFTNGVTNVSGFTQNVCGIEITNLSAFPVTVTEIGIHPANSTHKSIFLPPFMGGVSLPSRLEAREQMTAFIPAENVNTNLKYKDVYAKMACGVVVIDTDLPSSLLG